MDELKLSRKFDVSSSIPIDWFIFCDNGLFAGTTLTRHKSQVHFSGFIQCLAVLSLQFTHVRSFACKHRRSQGGLGGHVPPKFLELIVICALRDSIPNKIVVLA